jgi:hypothetical protein
MGDYARIGFLVEIADSQQSTLMSALATKAATDLVASWNHNVPEFSFVIGLLQQLRERVWFLSRGGREMYRSLLNGMLEQVVFASAYEWLEILAFPDGALDWTDEDEQSVSSALKRYREDGIDQERSECTTLDELMGLRESLDELSKKYGLDFASTIRSLDEDIAERDDSREYEGEEYSYRGGSGGTYQEAVSDEDVAEMFNTLHNGD